MLLNKISTTENKEPLEDRFCELLNLESPFCTPRMEDLPNLQEIRECDFWWYRAAYSFKAEAWCGQIQLAERDPHPNNRSGNPAWGNLFLYLVDRGILASGGYAVLWNHNWMDYSHKPIPSGFSITPP